MSRLGNVVPSSGLTPELEDALLQRMLSTFGVQCANARMAMIAAGVAWERGLRVKFVREPGRSRVWNVVVR